MRMMHGHHCTRPNFASTQELIAEDETKTTTESIQGRPSRTRYTFIPLRQRVRTEKGTLCLAVENAVENAEVGKGECSLSVATRPASFIILACVGDKTFLSEHICRQIESSQDTNKII